jgi:DNA-binding protein YbaB
LTNEPTLAEITAELDRHSRRLAERQARLAEEQVTVRALDGRLSATAAADGRLLALHIDPAAVRGPQGRQLGEQLAQLITEVRRQAAERRAELESE